MSWQGYGPTGQPEYPLPAGYPGPPPPPRQSNNTGLVVLIVTLAAVAVLIFGAAGLWVAVSDDRTPPAVAASGSPSAAPTASSPPPSPSAGPSPKVAGWQAVASDKYKVVYDVPKSWKVNKPDTVIGFEDPKGNILATMSATAEFGQGHCPTNKSAARAAVGFNGYVDTGLNAVAEDAARKWANAAYRPDDGPAPTVSLTRPRPLKVGGMRAVQVTAQAVVRSKDKCDPPRGAVRAIAMPGRGDSKTTVLIIWSDQNVSGAASNTHVRKMIKSLRPLG